MSNVGFKIMTFGQLSVTQLYNILQLRTEIFVVEQNCVYQDMDGKDEEALHFFKENDYDGQILAYCRIFGPNIMYAGFSSIGRVVVRHNARGQGLARQMMKEAIGICKAKYQNVPIKISAQNYLLEFYSSLDFVPVGETYLEDDIPHTAMILHSIA